MLFSFMVVLCLVMKKFHTFTLNKQSNLTGKTKIICIFVNKLSDE